MCLRLIDLPRGSATQILAIAIVAPEARFEAVIDESRYCLLPRVHDGCGPRRVRTCSLAGPIRSTIVLLSLSLMDTHDEQESESGHGDSDQSASAIRKHS